MLARTGFEQMVNFPTLLNRILEITLTNRPFLVNKCEGMPGLSDHNDIVYLDLAIHACRRAPIRHKNPAVEANRFWCDKIWDKTLDIQLCLLIHNNYTSWCTCQGNKITWRVSWQNLFHLNSAQRDSANLGLTALQNNMSQKDKDLQESPQKPTKIVIGGVSEDLKRKLNPNVGILTTNKSMTSLAVNQSRIIVGLITLSPES